MRVARENEGDDGIRLSPSNIRRQNHQRRMKQRLEKRINLIMRDQEMNEMKYSEIMIKSSCIVALGFTCEDGGDLSTQPIEGEPEEKEQATSSRSTETRKNNKNYIEFRSRQKQDSKSEMTQEAKNK